MYYAIFFINFWITSSKIIIQERPEFIPDKACVLRADAANRPKVELLREKELELDVSTFSTKP